ncbi:hypothetical protein ACVJF2_001340 [Bradyrhizobium sp. USDA 4519]
MYSSHRIDSVTCLRRSSRCTAVQSGSACRRWPRRVPGPAPALANSRASSAASVMSSGNGQVSPAASNRWIVNRTVEGAVPTRRAISRVGIPADFNLITSRTWRIANLSVGIQVPLRKAERRDRIGARRGLVTPGSPLRYPGRHHPGMAGDIKSERWARSFRNRGRHRAESADSETPDDQSLSRRCDLNLDIPCDARPGAARGCTLRWRAAAIGRDSRDPATSARHLRLQRRR